MGFAVSNKNGQVLDALVGNFVVAKVEDLDLLVGHGLGLLGDVIVAAKAAEGRELCEVDAGGENLAVPGQDDRAAVLVVGQQPEGLSNLSVMKIFIFSFWKVTWGAITHYVQIC